MCTCDSCSRDCESLIEVNEVKYCEGCLETLTECNVCSCRQEYYDFNFIEGEPVCDSCEEELPTCDHCNDKVIEVNEHNLCSSCEEHYCNCDKCGEHVYEDDVVTTYNDEYLCENCQHEGAIPEDRDYWYPFEMLYWNEEEELWYKDKPSPIVAYHDGVKEKINISSSGKYTGFELEIIPKVDRDDLAEEVIKLGNFCCENDSSLDDDGFEVISNYGDIEHVLDLASDLSDTLKGKAVSHDTDCCGLHVHLTNKDDDFINSKMVVFWNDPDNFDFILEFARRNCPTYARRDPGKNKEELEDGEDVLDSLYSDHYGIISLGDYTVEVRAFRGTIAKPRLLACIELAYYSYEYCAKDDVYAKDLTWESFMQWLPEESKYIKPYLETRKGFLEKTKLELVY